MSDADGLEHTEVIADIHLNEFLTFILGFKKYRITQAVLLFMNMPVAYQVFFSYFTGHNPSWKCVSNKVTSTNCNETGTFSTGDNYYGKRCALKHSEWMYTLKASHSYTTEVRQNMFLRISSFQIKTHIYTGTDTGTNTHTHTQAHRYRYVIYVPHDYFSSGIWCANAGTWHIWLRQVSILDVVLD